MHRTALQSCFFSLLLVVSSFFGSCASPGQPSEKEFISSIEIDLDGIQREKEGFQIRNLSQHQAEWSWEVSDAETGKVIESSSERDPRFTLSRGVYDITVTAKGQNTLRRQFRRGVTVLPKAFTKRQADEVIDLSSVKDNVLMKDYGSRKRPGYRILIKGTFKGRFKITGLRGTKKNPVHIINEGHVIIEATNDSSPYAWQFSDNNQYILIDGRGDIKHRYGFTVSGHASKSGQVLFIAGEFNRGFEIAGVKLVGSQGKTYGAAAIQVQPSYTKSCNAQNWNFEYLRFHHNRIERASSEGMYIGYFTDEARETGFLPFRMGKVDIYRDTILQCGWDGIQIASADDFEVHDNHLDGAGLSGKRSHSSLLSWNSGNTTGACYRNTFMNGAHAASIIFGESGKTALIYSNLFIEGQSPENITSPAFFFSKLYNGDQDVSLYIFHNTIVTSRISAKIDYRNQKKSSGIPVIYAANAIVQNRINLKHYPEIAMGSNLNDSASWTINNVWRMKEDEHELQMGSGYRPLRGSPLMGIPFDIRKYLSAIKGGFYDRDGYPLFDAERGFTAGCFSAIRISPTPQP